MSERREETRRRDGGKEARQEREISNGRVGSGRVLFIQRKGCERARGLGRSKTIREETETEPRWTEAEVMEDYCVYVDLISPVTIEVPCFLVCARKRRTSLPGWQQSLCFSVLTWYSRGGPTPRYGSWLGYFEPFIYFIDNKREGERGKCRLGCSEEGKY